MALIQKGTPTSAQTRHIDIRYFFVKDKVDSEELEIVYLPTGEMRADIMTKALQGPLFRKMRAYLMGMPNYVEEISSEDDGDERESAVKEAVAPRGA
jgi:hypothetical protein